MRNSVANFAYKFDNKSLDSQASSIYKIDSMPQNVKKHNDTNIDIPCDDDQNQKQSKIDILSSKVKIALQTTPPSKNSSPNTNVRSQSISNYT